MSVGSAAVADYELLELLLFPAIPRKDIKPLAKSLIQRFGSFAGVINTDTRELMAVTGLGEVGVTAIKITQAAIQRVLKEEVRDRSVLANWQSVLDYCRVLMAHQQIEEFRLLFLDSQHRVIADELQQTGTINHTPVYPREVVKRALELGAASIIMVHNHPSGDPTPSRADIEMTKEVAKAAASLGVQLHDHVIVGRSKHASLRSMGLF